LDTRDQRSAVVHVVGSPRSRLTARALRRLTRRAAESRGARSHETWDVVAQHLFSRGRDEILAKTLVVIVTFMPLFGFWEIYRVPGSIEPSGDNYFPSTASAFRNGVSGICMNPLNG
jgi:hypothetical protein